jgi:hypothetical protein
LPIRGDRFKVFRDSIKNFFYRVRVIERRAEERAALQTARELTSELFHPADGR